MTILFEPVTPQPITVYLVEASEETRALVAGFLERSGRIRVIGSAADGSSAASDITDLDPDVVVVDRFPGPELLSADHRVVLHATTFPERTATELQRAGIHAIVFKEVGMLGELVETVLRAADRTTPVRSHSGSRRPTVANSDQGSPIRARQTSSAPPPGPG